MSIATEITRISDAKAAIKAAIEDKGVTVGSGTIDTYAERIADIPSGETYTGGSTITSNGTLACSGKLMPFDLLINVPAGAEGTISGKFTGKTLPISLDCSGLNNPPSTLILACPDMVNIGVGSTAVMIAKGIGTSVTSSLLIVDGRNTAELRSVQTSVKYDAATASITITGVLNVVSSYTYYWTAY